MCRTGGSILPTRLALPRAGEVAITPQLKYHERPEPVAVVGPPLEVVGNEVLDIRPLKPSLAS